MILAASIVAVFLTTGGNALHPRELYAPILPIIPSSTPSISTSIARSTASSTKTSTAAVTTTPGASSSSANVRATSSRNSSGASTELEVTVTVVASGTVDITTLSRSSATQRPQSSSASQRPLSSSVSQRPSSSSAAGSSTHRASSSSADQRQSSSSATGSSTRRASSSSATQRPTTISVTTITVVRPASSAGKTQAASSSASHSAKPSIKTVTVYPSPGRGSISTSHSTKVSIKTVTVYPSPRRSSSSSSSRRRSRPYRTSTTLPKPDTTIARPKYATITDILPVPLLYWDNKLIPSPPPTVTVLEQTILHPCGSWRLPWDHRNCSKAYTTTRTQNSVDAMYSLSTSAARKHLPPPLAATAAATVTATVTSSEADGGKLNMQIRPKYFPYRTWSKAPRPTPYSSPYPFPSPPRRTWSFSTRIVKTVSA